MILFDAHVHMYDCFQLDLLVESAFTNFSKAAEELGVEEAPACFLLLAESQGVDYYSRLCSMCHERTTAPAASWRVTPTGEDRALRLNHADWPGRSLFVVAGRQVVTTERLEVLALFTTKKMEQGCTLRDTVAAARDAGGLAVCPWGAGKWLGVRGKTLAAFIENDNNQQLLLGDSGVRPALWPLPGLLRRPPQAQRLLSGSDPLPLAGEERRVAGFGGVIADDCDDSMPAACLQGLLSRPETVISGFGRSPSMLTFVRQQLALRMH